MVAPPASLFEAVLEHMYRRVGEDTLPAHLEESLGITVTKLRRLDVGVFRVDRADGPPVVARMFSSARPFATAEGDLAVLQYLAEVGFRSERPIGEAPLSVHDGQAVLVTELVKQVPKPRRPPYPVHALGRMIGRLNGLAVPLGADRPAGALHHFAVGTMSDELRAAAGWLGELPDREPAADVEAVEALRAAVESADGGDGLPEALIHPDPVPSNAVFTEEGPVLVDWTSAGRGPRLAAVSLLLRSSWAAAPFMRGYAKETRLTAEERDRIAGLLFSRALILLVFGACRNPKTLTAAAKKLPALRRDCDQKATVLSSV